MVGWIHPLTFPTLSPFNPFHPFPNNIYKTCKKRTYMEVIIIFAKTLIYHDQNSKEKALTNKSK